MMQGGWENGVSSWEKTESFEGEEVGLLTYICGGGGKGTSRR